MRLTLRRWQRAIPIVATALWCGSACARYEPETWLQQFAKLRADMAAHYANLDWMVSYRKIDLRALTLKTEAELRNARTDGQGRKALARFIESFRDPHLRLVKSADPQRSAERPRDESSCAERGFGVRRVARPRSSASGPTVRDVAMRMAALATLISPAAAPLVP